MIKVVLFKDKCRAQMVIKRSTVICFEVNVSSVSLIAMNEGDHQLDTDACPCLGKLYVLFLRLLLMV